MIMIGLCLDLFAAHFQLNSLLLLPTEASENHSQSIHLFLFSPPLSTHLSAPGLTIDSLLIGLPKTRLSPLQTVLNAAARLIARLPRYSHTAVLSKKAVTAFFDFFS